MESYGFIITRHVNSEKTNKYWNKCVRCIRAFYPLRKIIIIDDNSNQSFIKADFQYSNIEMHLFTMELNSFTMCDISYKTHPDLQLLTAIHMTCAIPILFSPVCIDDKCYVDGGIVTNYPLDNCLREYPNVDEILAFKNKYCDIEKKNITDDSNMFELIISFIGKMVVSLSTESKQTTIKNQIEHLTQYMTIDYITRTLESEQYRKQLFDNGTEGAVNFLLLEKPTHN